MVIPWNEPKGDVTIVAEENAKRCGNLFKPTTAFMFWKVLKASFQK